MKYVTRIIAAAALLTPGVAFAASPAAFAGACCALAACCGMPCC